MFGLHEEEIQLLKLKFTCSPDSKVKNCTDVSGHPVDVINALGSMGLKIVSSCVGNKGAMWTFERIGK